MMHNNETIKRVWHDLGVPVHGAKTTKEAIIRANMDIPIEKRSIYHATSTFDAQGKEILTYHPIDNNFALVRVDNDAVFNIVSSEYTIFSNLECFSFMDELLGKDKLTVETCGSLYGGKKIWIQCVFPDNIEVVNTDIIKKYLTLVSSHDSTTPVKIVLGTQRIVCANTLTTSLQNDQVKMKIKHKVRLEDNLFKVKDSIGIIQEAYTAFADNLRNLVSVHLTQGMIDNIGLALFPLIGEKEDSKGKTQQVNSFNRVLHYYENGLGQNIPGVRGTAYALLNGYTEFSDTEKMMNSNKVNLMDSKWESALIGREAQQKQEAMQTISRVVLM
ncbi:MAG TPA: DUF932 domain-containing protein [Aquella sp.]|nr:DUF932 domain-containing protein [Aquella sp.]